MRTEAAVLEQLSRAHAVSRTLLLMELVDSMARANIPVVVLKGPAIGVVGYDDCSRRTFSDADLLLRRNDLARARDFLVARGYTPHSDRRRERALIAGHSALEFSNSRAAVELHWTLLSRHLRFNLSVDDLWSRSRLIQCTGSEMRVLAPEHCFLYLCAHGAKHEWTFFRWICDIAQKAPRWGDANPENFRQQTGLGLQFYQSNDFPKAEAAFRKALEHAPQDAIAYNNLGSALNAPGKFERSDSAASEGGFVSPRFRAREEQPGFCSHEQSQAAE